MIHLYHHVAQILHAARRHAAQIINVAASSHVILYTEPVRP